ncbi:hypothetical protein WA171_003612 [Blastocystis sp. BT1]
MVILGVTLLYVLLLIRVSNGEEFTCHESSTILHTNTQCLSVTWSVARVISTENRDPSSYAPSVASLDTQEQMVTNLYNNYTQQISLSSSCSQKLLNFVCTNAYPYCPVPYAYASYWRACRSECLSIQKNCGPIPNLNCDDYEENDFFCYRILGSSQFQLSFSESDRFAVLVYWLSFGINLLLLCCFSYFLYYGSSVSTLHKFFAGVLFLKMISSCVNAVTFKGVADNFGVGNYYGGLAVICLQLLATTFDLFFFLLLSKGWCVIYTSLLFSEWVRYYILGILVYCSDGFMLIFNMETSASLFYHMMCLGIFLLLFIDMIASDSFMLFKTRLRMERIFRDGLNPYTHITFQKYRYAYIIRILLWLRLGFMLIRHGLFPLLQVNQSRVAVTLLATLSDTLLLSVILILYPLLSSSLFSFILNINPFR